MIALSQNPLVFAGAGNSLGIELPGDLDLAPSLLKEVKDPPHHLGRGGINHQTAVVGGVFLVAVAGEGPHKLPPLLLGVDSRSDFVRNIPGVLGIEDVFHGQEHVVAPLPAVHMVIDGDEPHPPGRKDPLQISAHLNVIPPKPGQILDQHAVYPSLLNVRLHPPEGGAVKAGAGVAVVLIKLHQMQLRAGCQILLQQLALVGDAVALRLVAVLPGEAQIARCVPSLHNGPISYRAGLTFYVTCGLWAWISALSSASGSLLPSKCRVTRRTGAETGLDPSVAMGLSPLFFHAVLKYYADGGADMPAPPRRLHRRPQQQETALLPVREKGCLIQTELQL